MYALAGIVIDDFGKSRKISEGVSKRGLRHRSSWATRQTTLRASRVEPTFLAHGLLPGVQLGDLAAYN